MSVCACVVWIGGGERGRGLWLDALDVRDFFVLHKCLMAGELENQSRDSSSLSRSRIIRRCAAGGAGWAESGTARVCACVCVCGPVCVCGFAWGGGWWWWCWWCVCGWVGGLGWCVCVCVVVGGVGWVGGEGGWLDALGVSDFFVSEGGSSGGRATGYPGPPLRAQLEHN